MSFEWTKKFNFELQCLQFGKISSRNKIIVICHRDPEEEKRRSREFCKKIEKATFHFSIVKDVQQCYEEIKSNPSFSNIVFAICQSVNCEQCTKALQLRAHLQEMSLVTKTYEGKQYKLKNLFIRGNRLIYSKLVVSGSGWMNYLKQKIKNKSSTKILVLSGGHGRPSGGSAFDDHTLEDRELYKDDLDFKDELKDDEATNKMFIKVVDLTTFRRDIDSLTRYIRRGKFNFIVMAFCHSYYSKLRHKLENEGVQYTHTFFFQEEEDLIVEKMEEPNKQGWVESKRKLERKEVQYTHTSFFQEEEDLVVDKMEEPNKQGWVESKRISSSTRTQFFRIICCKKTKVKIKIKDLKRFHHM